MKFVFALLAIAAVAHGFVIPSFDFEVQQGKNVIDEFVREAILFVEQIVKAKEPVTLPDLGAQTIKDTDVDITLTLSGVKVDKFDNLAINNLKNDFPLLSASFDVSAPAPHVEGNFEVSGTVMQKAVSGKGTFSVDLDGLEQSGFVQIQIVGNSIQIEKLTLDYTLPDAKKVVDELLTRLDYVYLAAGRVIVRQGREAGAMYFIVTGTVEADHSYPDPIFSDETLHDVDKFGYGDSFGEIPLFYGEPHRATITVLDSGVEMLVLNKSDFKIVLEESLSSQWASIRWAMTKFPYFERWPEDAIRYLCSHSSLISTPCDVLIPVKDVNGLGIAIFVLEGTIKVIQRMLVLDNKDEDKVEKRFSLYSNQNLPPNRLPPKVVPIYMQTVKLTRNAVFGLGEQMSKHTMMTETDTLLMICPRFIIDRYNIINVWTRVVGILNFNHPPIEKVFEAFMQNRMWARNRKQFAKSIHMPQADKNMTIHSTPVSSRATNCFMKHGLYKKITNMPEYKHVIEQMRVAHQRKKKCSNELSAIIDEKNEILFDDDHRSSTSKSEPSAPEINPGFQ